MGESGSGCWSSQRGEDSEETLVPKRPIINHRETVSAHREGVLSRRDERY